MRKIFLFDIARCSGCFTCQLACKDEHALNDWLPYAAAQPLTGQFWMKVQEHVCGTIPKVRIHYIPRLCNHCDNPVCRDVCPEKAIEKRDDGLVLIRPELCTGCGRCAEACPYDVIYFHPDSGIAQKCTGCAHLLDHGHTLPRCVDACPTDALRYGDEEELLREAPDAVVPQPEAGLSPRVYYRHIPGRFVAGTLYDPVEKEVIIAARCRLTGEKGDYETESDAYGDFWFNNLPEGEWTLTVTAEGFRPLAIDGISTDLDRNLGDLPMDKA